MSDNNEATEKAEREKLDYLFSDAARAEQHTPHVTTAEVARREQALRESLIRAIDTNPPRKGTYTLPDGTMVKRN